LAPNPGGNNPAVVQDENVAFVQKFWKIFELRMDDFSLRSVDDHHPRLVPLRERLLGDELLGQGIVKI
jgi:hypothetical protein